MNKEHLDLLKELAAAYNSKGTPRDERWPDRRERIISKLAQLWQMYPDQRLGQLVLNVARGQPEWPDVFNVEDDVFEKLLDKALKGEIFS